MDVTFNNVLEGTRQYFMGLPNASSAQQGAGSGPATAPDSATAAPVSGDTSDAPTSSPRPPSAAPTSSSGPADTHTSALTPPPPRPPSEPLEPEPHIIHKATVMREALEKRRECPEPEDEDDNIAALSPPSHIIRKPPHALPSPVSAHVAPSSSPVRPSSTVASCVTGIAQGRSSLSTPPHVRAPTPRRTRSPDTHSEPQPPPPPPLRPSSSPYQHQYHTPVAAAAVSPARDAYLAVRPSDHYTGGRPPDPYSISRPPDIAYSRYPYDSSAVDSRNSVLPGGSPQPTAMSRHSPQQTHARLSNTTAQHANTVRLKEIAAPSPPTQRYSVHAPPPVATSTLPFNDRVPPIYHPSSTASSATLRVAQPDSRSSHSYIDHRFAAQRVIHENSSFVRPSVHYERHSPGTPRKHDAQHAYPGYRPSTATALPSQKPVNNLRIETQQQLPLQYKHAVDTTNAYYPSRLPERPRQADSRPQDAARLPPPHVEYPHMIRSTEDLAAQSSQRSSCSYVSPSTSTNRFSRNAPLASVHNPALHQRNLYRPDPSAKPIQDYSSANHIVQTSPTRPTAKSGYPPQQSRLTVSVTSLVNQMNQTKQQKRESPLDLSVKTVKNSADSSTTQEDIELMTTESKNMAVPLRPSLNSRQVSSAVAGYVASHKVDFAPDFQSQYRDRLNLGQNSCVPAVSASRYNGAYNNAHSQPDPYRVETRQNSGDHSKCISSARHKYPMSRTDVTRSLVEDKPGENRLRDDRNTIIEDNRKRLSGPVISNIPEKLRRYETWTSDSRIDHASWSAREQHELMSRPVYSYSSHKRFEAYNDHKRPTPSLSCRDASLPCRDIGLPCRDVSTNSNSLHKYSYPTIEPSARNDNNYYIHNVDKSHQNSVRQIIQKIPNHKDSTSNSYDHRSGIPADKRVLSILRNSLETKHTGFVEPARSQRQIPDLIVIDDVDDSVIEITDLTKDNDTGGITKAYPNPPLKPAAIHKIHIPRAIDSFSNAIDHHNNDNKTDAKSKSPENDVASRIRTKAELKVLPPSQENAIPVDVNTEVLPGKGHSNQRVKILPKSQKQHLFNQIREDNLRLESVIKADSRSNTTITEIKSEPMNIEEIEKDAMTIKTENHSESLSLGDDTGEKEDLFFDNCCDSFIEQLKIGINKKRNRRKHDAENDKNEENSKSFSQVKLKENLNLVTFTETCTTDQVESQSDSVPVIKQEPIDEELEEKTEMKEGRTEMKSPQIELNVLNVNKSREKEAESVTEENLTMTTEASPMSDREIFPALAIKKETPDENTELLTHIKVESESTDDDEPLIKSKLLKEKEKKEKHLKYQLLKDLSEKSAYVKLECCDADLSKSVKSELLLKENEVIIKSKDGKQSSRTKSKTIDKKAGKQSDNIISDSDDELSVACRLRTRRSLKNEGEKSVVNHKTTSKASPSKKQEALSNSSPTRKVTAPVGSNFYPGWEEELYRYKRSLRMPTRLIAIPRGRSGGPFAHNSTEAITRGSTSLPDLDPAPLSPAPSSAPSTDDIFVRRPDKLTLDSDLESNSSCSVPNRLHYDSEASTSTVLSTKPKKKGESILDVLIQKYGKKEEVKNKTKEEIKLKSTFKTLNDCAVSSSSNANRLKNASKEVKKDNVEEVIHVDTTNNISETFKVKSKTDKRISKHRKSLREVFSEERPASAPPTSSGDNVSRRIDETTSVSIRGKKKMKKNLKEDFKKKTSTIRDGLRSTKSLKRNDAKGRLLRLKKRNHIMRNLVNKKIKDATSRQRKEQKKSNADNKQETITKENSDCPDPPDGIKKRYRRLFGRRKFSSGFDYIRKKKKTIVRDESIRKVRKHVTKPSPESVNDIQKEIKSWFINKSIGETSLHRAARLGYMDCVAYCLEKLDADPSSRDNAGFTPLHVAAARGYVRIARLLLQYGANVSAAAQGGIRPLHEACENSHLEMIRLLLAYGADPVLGTYAGQTPAELAEGGAAHWLRLHIADVQGQAVEPWKFHSPAHIIDPEEVGCDPLASPPPTSPPPAADTIMEFQCTDAPLPPFYSLRASSGQPVDGLWCLLQDLISLLQIKSKDSLLKQIHCGSGSPKELLRELRTQEFLERAQCHQLLGAGEKVNVRASKVALIRVTDKLRQLLNIETVLVS